MMRSRLQSQIRLNGWRSGGRRKTARLVLSWVVALGILVLLAPPPAEASLSCGELFRPLGSEVRTISILGSPLEARFVRTPERKGFVRAKDVLTPEQLKTALVIGFANTHTYLYYNGFRIDSNGLAGEKVTSSLKKTDTIYGDLLFVLSDLPDDVRKRLAEEIANFKARSKLTCTGTTCAYLETFDPRHFSKTRLLRPTKLVQKLIEVKKARTQKTEVVIVNSSEFDGSMKDDIAYEKLTMQIAADRRIGQAAMLFGLGISSVAAAGGIWQAIILLAAHSH